MPNLENASMRVPLVYTPGEPAGIGPDLILSLAYAGLSTPIVVMASKALLAQRAEALDIKITLRDWEGVLPPYLRTGELFVHDIPLPSPCEAGTLNIDNASYVLRCLDEAIEGCLVNTFSALVTGPLHKGIVNEAGISFSGHTEHLQQRCGVDKVVMMLANRNMRVALATTHLPLSQVSKAITSSGLREVIRILIDDLQHKFSITRPRILVSGLNPHAGEGGHMGREEIDVIEPVIAEFADHSVDLTGPLPADTLFTPKYLDNADAVLAMYHDQGLPVLKFDGFGESVNITLGLPMIRTSVDHGTALDLAGTGNADTGSLSTAIQVAEDMVTNHHA